VTIEGGEHIQNQQNSSHNYQQFAIRWLNFPKTDRYKVSVACLDGNVEFASLKAIQFTPIR
jgi:alpha-L-fucosidase